MRRIAGLVAAAALMLSASGCSSLHGTGNTGVVTQDGTATQIAPSDRSAPVSLTGKDLDGKPLSLASFRGKPTVVTTWGSWCGSCHGEQPMLVAAAEQLGSSVHFVGIDSRDDGTAQARVFEHRYGVTWPSFFSPSGEALLAFPHVFTPDSVPSTVILDAQGRPAASIAGAIPSSLTLVEMARQVMRGG